MDEYGAETVQNLHFFYDAQSRPAFVEYNGTKYRYIHNLQGDIVGIVDGNGNLVVEYKYDAWGKPIAITGTLKTSLGALNPFRYRGYVWDNESSLYYLRDRYYVTKVGRMLNADSFLGTENCGANHNTYCYCKNAPIIKADPNGKFAISVVVPCLVSFVSAMLAGICANEVGRTHKKSNSNKKVSLKTRVFLTEVAVLTTYYSIRSKAKEKDKAISITQEYRIEGDAYYCVVLSDEGILAVGDPLSFEVAFNYAVGGENIWTPNESDILALANAVAAYTGYSVTPSYEQSDHYRECKHYHLKRGTNKYPTHFFFGMENVAFW